VLYSLILSIYILFLTLYIKSVLLFKLCLLLLLFLNLNFHTSFSLFMSFGDFSMLCFIQNWYKIYKKLFHILYFMYARLYTMFINSCNDFGIWKQNLVFSDRRRKFSSNVHMIKFLKKKKKINIWFFFYFNNFQHILCKIRVVINTPKRIKFYFSQNLTTFKLVVNYLVKISHLYRKK
jgi:hypothetical protein